MLNRQHLANEWRFLSRHPLVWLGIVGFCGINLLLANGSPAIEPEDAIGALLRLNLFVPVLTLPFLAGALGPVFFLRETEHGMDEVLAAYPLAPRQWLAMRAGSFAAMLLAACLMVQLAFVALLAADHSLRLVSLLAHTALLFFTVHAPACLIWTAGLAWLSCRKANSGYLYFATGLGWLAYLSFATLTGTPLIAGSFVAWQPLKQAMLVLDPYAATALLNPVPEHGLLRSKVVDVAAGRLLWLLVGLGVLGAIKDIPARAGRLGTDVRAVQDGETATRWRSPACLSHIALHLRYFGRDNVFALILGAWVILLGTESFVGLDYAEPFSRVTSDSRDALNSIVWDVLPIAAALLLLYAADRICRMYSATGMHELYAASPHRPLQLAAVQLVSLWLITTGFLVLAGIAVLLAQLAAQTPVQAGEYLLQLGMVLPRLALTAIVLVAVHGLIRARFMANLVGLFLIALGQTGLAPAMGLDHPLWKVLDTPLTKPDHYWGFEGSAAGHLTFLLFWIPVGLAALALAIATHHRTLPFAQPRSGTVIRHPASLTAAVFLAAAALQGSAIKSGLDREGALETTDGRNLRRADYERHYAGWSRIPQPDVAELHSAIAFHPAENRVSLTAILRLINRSGQPIDRVLVGRNVIDAKGTVRLEGARIARHDAALGQTVFVLDRPMQTGDSADLLFETELVQPGLASPKFPLVLRPSFSSLPAHALLPVIGYHRELTLRARELRRKYRLPAMDLSAPSRIPLPPPHSLAAKQAILDTVVSTDIAQHAIAQGEQVRQWREGGRAFFHYRTSAPIRNMLAVFSLPMRPQLWQAGRVGLETYSPQPLASNDPNVLGARDTLVWLEREIAPYPGNRLRLVAIPEIGPSGFALPQIMQISFRLGFRARPEAGAAFDQRYRRAVHETAHQWFGHLLGYGIPEERAFLVESLAKYAELVMVEQRYGKPAMRALVEFERDRYLQARLDPDGPIAPLIDADDAEDMYSRATLAFACLRDKVGDEPILAALRQIAESSRRTATPARSLDFLAALKETGEPEMRYPLKTLFLGTNAWEIEQMTLDCGSG